MDPVSISLLTAAVGTASTAGTAAAGAGGFMTALSALGTAASIGGTIMGGMAQKQSAEFEAGQIEMNSEMQRLQAKQEEANRQKRLNEILGTQMAMTAGRGIQVGSGSDIAIADFSMEEKAREDSIASADLSFSQAMNSARAGQSRIRGKAALTSSLFQAGGKAFGAYSTAKERSRTGGAKSGNLDIDWKT